MVTCSSPWHENKGLTCHGGDHSKLTGSPVRLLRGQLDELRPNLVEVESFRIEKSFGQTTCLFFWPFWWNETYRTFRRARKIVKVALIPAVERVVPGTLLPFLFLLPNDKTVKICEAIEHLKI